MKFKYLTLSVIIILLTVTSSVLGQQSISGKVKEIYLSGDLIHLTNLGIGYKSQIGDNTYFRIGLAGLNIDVNKMNSGLSTSLDQINSSYSASLDIGLEKRKSITGALTCFYGINLYNSVGFIRDKTEDPSLPRDLRFTDDFSINSGFGFNSGLILHVFNSFSVATEFTPRLLYNYNSHQNIINNEKVSAKTNNFSFSVYNWVSFSVIYSWTK